MDEGVGMLKRLSLTSRVVLINGALFTAATTLLAVSPATVSKTPLPTEVVVLVAGLCVLIVANTLLVGTALRPLDRLVRQLDSSQPSGPVEPIELPPSGIARRLGTALNQLLERIDAAQRESDAAALAAQEAERSRIAQELHDGVGQSLTAILLEVGVLADQLQTQELEDLREAVRSSLDEVRGVARRLRPHVLEDLGLRSALAALTNELFGRGDTHVRRGIMPGLPVLDDARELVVFRVAQEALTNVARHARATTVDLSMGVQGSNVVLSVTDDGIGVRPGREGTGIRGMRERAALVGGTLQITRVGGRGTRVVLTVPTVDA